MRISDWSSDVCSSDLLSITHKVPSLKPSLVTSGTPALKRRPNSPATKDWQARAAISGTAREFPSPVRHADRRSEEHTSELQSLMRNSYAVFCLKKKNKRHAHT